MIAKNKAPLKSIESIYYKNYSDEPQEIHEYLLQNCYIEDNKEDENNGKKDQKKKISSLTVLFHSKYKTVTWILIINIVLVGMNGYFTYRAALKATGNYIKENGGVVVFAAVILEFIKLLGISAYSYVGNGQKNRKIVFH